MKHLKRPYISKLGFLMLHQQLEKKMFINLLFIKQLILTNLYHQG